jgi:hypothetical protein
MFVFVGALLLASSAIFFYWFYVEVHLPEPKAFARNENLMLTVVCAVLGIFTAGVLVTGFSVARILAGGSGVIDAALTLGVIAGAIALGVALRRKLKRAVAGGNTAAPRPPANDMSAGRRKGAAGNRAA